MLPNNIALLPHEIEHYEALDKIASECTLFFKRDKSFPINAPCKVALFGSGARHTLKGGSGSGDVNSHFFNNVEEELELHNFVVTTKKWLDEYDVAKAKNKIEFIKQMKKEAKEKKMGAAAYSVGNNQYEFEHNISIKDYEGDICIYVLSRNGGEDADRRRIKGDVFLTDKEIEDILYLNERYEKFMLVLNVPGVIDISPVLQVRNIFYLSQLGVVTSSVLVNVILGKCNPSGKLSTTWARPLDYRFIDEFGDRDDTRYKEGIYVGYRYFDSVNIAPMFPFGFGLSYSEFKHQIIGYSIDEDVMTLKVNVFNESEYAGKEVVQLYLGMDVEIDTPRHILVGFTKTGLIKPHESEEVEVSFKLSEFPIYNTELSRYELPKGTYLIEEGSSSRDLSPVVKLKLSETAVIKEVIRIENHIDFEDFSEIKRNNFDKVDVPTENIANSVFSSSKVKYFDKYEVEVPEIIKSLSIKDLIHMNLGDYKTGLPGIIGQTGSLVPGAAGETTLRVKDIKTALCMADGPAGLRLISEYLVNGKGTYQLQEDSIWRGIKDYLPGFFVSLMNVEKNRKKKGSIVYQYTTAIPIATACAQSFSREVMKSIGRLVSKEMEIYDVDIWLAPAMNIHRNILCGRNFEYYSEDPFLTGEIAGALVKAVQSNPSKMCTIKHFACNNQETNRFNNNSMVSIRALREIYLPGYARAIKLSRPAMVMTSYNLLNGIHTSSSHDLLTKILRCEMNYRGLVMTDWITTGQINDKTSIHPYKYASSDLVNGVNICMPGSKKDIKDIKLALKSGKITRKDLENNAAIVYSFILKKENN